MIHHSFLLRLSTLALIVTHLLIGQTALAKREIREPEAATGFNQKKAVFSKQYMVVAANPYASQAGLDMLDKGVVPLMLQSQRNWY